MIQIDWPTQTITVDRSDIDILTPLGGGVYRFDTDAFRLELKDREDDADGIVWPRTHRHNSTVTISGIQYVRTIEILNGYTITFTPNESWRVSMDGASNNNFHDVGILNMNMVQVIPQNSAGNTVTETQVSGLTLAESQALLDIDLKVDDLILDVGALSVLIDLLETSQTLTNLQKEAEHLTSRTAGQVILRNTTVMRRWEADAWEDEAMTVPYGTTPNTGIEAVGMLVEVAWV